MFKSKYIPTVLFEGVRLKSVGDSAPTAERYVVAQGYIHAKTGRREVEYYDCLGRRCGYVDAPAATKDITNAWMGGQNPEGLLCFGPVGNKESRAKPVPVMPPIEN